MRDAKVQPWGEPQSSRLASRTLRGILMEFRREHPLQRGEFDSRGWTSVCAVGLSTFSVVTTEMLPVGLMTPIADSLNTSVGNAGLTISVPAMLAALFAPIVVFLAGGIDRRHMLAGLLVLLTIANVSSAVAPTIGWLLGARVLVGFCIGGIWAIAGGLAPRLVPDRLVGLAMSVIFGGVAAASVLGVPIGAVISDLAGWRMAFGAMAIFSALVLAINLWALPALPISQSVKFSEFGAQTSRRPIQLGLIITFLFVAGHFMAYTFVRPLLEAISGVEVEWVGILLFAYGAAGIAGNFIAGPLASLRVGPTLIVIAVALAATIFGFAAFGGSPLGGSIILILWGVAYGGVSVALQTWIMKAAPSAVEVATSMFVAIFNIGIAIGSLVGGQVVDRFDLKINLLLAGILPTIGLLVALAIHTHSSRIGKTHAGSPSQLVAQKRQVP